MGNSFVERKAVRFRTWWRAPATAGDRARAFLAGGWAGLWLGALGRLMIGGMPVSIDELILFCVASAIALAVAGLAFPKVVACIAFPFAFFGAVGGGS